jgi:hypothetical protein
MASVSRTITIRVPRPVHITLARVPSDADPQRYYEIALDRHNLICCTCRSWRYNGHACKHLTAFRARLTEAA